MYDYVKSSCLYMYIKFVGLYLFLSILIIFIECLDYYKRGDNIYQLNFNK